MAQAKVPPPVFKDGGSVQKITPAAPSPNRPAVGGLAGKPNINESTYHGGRPDGEPASPGEEVLDVSSLAQEQE